MFTHNDDMKGYVKKMNFGGFGGHGLLKVITITI